MVSYQYQFCIGFVEGVRSALECPMPENDHIALFSRLESNQHARPGFSTWLFLKSYDYMKLAGLIFIS